jgi:hypothetical protein
MSHRSAPAAIAWRGLVAGALIVVAGLTSTPARADPAQLRQVYETLSKAPADPRFHRPFRIDSNETSDSASGEAFGLVDHSFASLSAALADPSHWCDILILHVNNKACRVSAHADGATIVLRVARKYDQPVDQATPMELSYRLVEATPQHLAVQLASAEGPMGTSDYRIVLEAIPLREGHAFLRFSYSYRWGTMARMAMGVYFATVGRGKVGFSEAGPQVNGQPQFIGGNRGLVERNTMRYFLAIEAYLAAPGANQFEPRLRHWFEATERHPRQLHEVDMVTFMDIKRRESRL